MKNEDHDVIFLVSGKLLRFIILGIVNKEDPGFNVSKFMKSIGLPDGTMMPVPIQTANAIYDLQNELSIMHRDFRERGEIIVNLRSEADELRKRLTPVEVKP